MFLTFHALLSTFVMLHFDVLVLNDRFTIQHKMCIYYLSVNIHDVIFPFLEKSLLYSVNLLLLSGTLTWRVRTMRFIRA